MRGDCLQEVQQMTALRYLDGRLLEPASCHGAQQCSALCCAAAFSPSGRSGMGRSFMRRDTGAATNLGIALALLSYRHRFVVRPSEVFLTTLLNLQVQILLDIAQAFISPTARLLVGRWEDDKVSSSSALDA